MSMYHMESSMCLSRWVDPRRKASLLLNVRPGSLAWRDERVKRQITIRAIEKNPNLNPNNTTSNISSRSISSSSSSSSSGSKKKGVPISNYVVPLDISSSSCITRPLAEILRDLNKRVPDNFIKLNSNCIIPWYHANRMLSFYAPGWCGEIRDVIFSENGRVTVVYRVTIRGSDGEAYRECTGTVSMDDGRIEDPVAAAEEIAFCRACARFGLGLYLYHEDETM